MTELHLAQNAEADEVISKDPLALLIGMVLDQQITIEKAFSGPLVLQERLGHFPTAKEIAEFDPDKFVEICATPPAIHRFPAANAKRIQDMAQIIVEKYDGDAEKIWTSAESGDDLYKRVHELPGFGEQKAKIFVALLGKQLNVKPSGWQNASKPFGDDNTHFSVADITDPESLAQVRAHKKELKAKAKSS